MSTTPNAIVDDASLASQSIVDSPETDAAATSVTDPVDQSDAARPDAGDQTVDDAASPKPGDQQDDLGTEGDARKLPGYIRSLKGVDDKAYAKAKTEFFDLNARRSVHSTVQAARDEHELVSSLGGTTGIAKLREDGQFFKSAATQFLKGDPAFVKDLWDEDPIAAALHVNPMLEAYKARDKAGYDSTLCKLWDNELQAVGFVERGLKPLAAAIKAGDKDAAMSILESIENWQNSVSRIARTAEDPRVKTLLAERAKQHETREQSEKQEFIKSYRTDAVNQVVEDGAKTFDSFFKGRKIDADDRTDLLREAFAAANRIVEADAQFKADRDAHIAAGDSASALKLTRARFAKEMPEAVKRIARRYGMFAGPAKATPTTPEKQQPTNNASPTAGFLKVNERPRPEDIDRSKTSNEMILGARAVLKNGRKIDWSHLRRAS